MIRFNLGNLAEWQHVGDGELVPFPLGDGHVRTVQFDVMCDAATGIFATRPYRGEGNLPDALVSEHLKDATWLVGFCPGGFASIRFVVSSDVSVYVQSEEGGSVFLRFGTEAQVRPERDIPSFVNLAPRPAGPGEDLRRMMRVMQLNHQQREQQLVAALGELHERVETLGAARTGPSQQAATPGAPTAEPPSTVPSSEKV